MAIHSLCQYPEYLEPLRQEAQVASTNNFTNEAEGMPLMDSFLRESARLNPIDGGTATPCYKILPGPLLTGDS